MSLWENPVKKELENNKVNRKDNTKEKVSEQIKSDQIIDLEEIMIDDNKNIYIASPIVARYNGARSESFNSLEMATISNKYLDFMLSNGNDQTFIR